VRARLVIGVALCLLGALWVGQGVGWIGGSFMSGQAVWAVIGAFAILLGVFAMRRPKRAPDPADGDR
jgi:hypothetical protein